MRNFYYKIYVAIETRLKFLTPQIPIGENLVCKNALILKIILMHNYFLSILVLDVDNYLNNLD